MGRFDDYAGIGSDDDRRGLDACELAELAALAELDRPSQDDCDDDDTLLEILAYVCRDSGDDR